MPNEVDVKTRCPVCHGSGGGVDPVFGNRGKCYPCDGTGKDHRLGSDHNKVSCWICKNWKAFGGTGTYA